MVVEEDEDEEVDQVEYTIVLSPVKKSTLHAVVLKFHVAAHIQSKLESHHIARGQLVRYSETLGAVLMTLETIYLSPSLVGMTFVDEWSLTLSTSV